MQGHNLANHCVDAKRAVDLKKPLPFWFIEQCEISRISAERKLL